MALIPEKNAIAFNLYQFGYKLKTAVSETENAMVYI